MDCSCGISAFAQRGGSSVVIVIPFGFSPSLYTSVGLCEYSKSKTMI